MTSSVPAIGDTAFLQDYLINTRVYGVVTPPGSPPEFLATYEIQGDQGTLVIAVAVGDKGPPGANMFALHLQADTIDNTGDLPQTLTNTVADIGKYWIIDDVDANGDIIGTSMYVWYGTTWRRLMVGSPGPPGPVPIITPKLTILPPEQVSTLTEDGTPWEPTMHFALSPPAGPQGPTAALALAPDIDFSTPPEPGDVLGFTGSYTSGSLSPPSGLLAVQTVTTGTLAANTYYYVVTAINAAGETTPSNEVSVQTSGSTSKIILAWEAAGSGNFGPTGYNIYRGTAPGAEGLLIGSVASTVVGFTDTGGESTTSQSPPTLSTAVVNFPVWVPVSISQLIPGPYSMPEGAFSGFSGISSAAAIGSFAIPPQSFPWTPIVWGHIGAFGVELSANPLMIGCEVLLGNPTTGTCIGRGFGNTLGEVNIMPHYSQPNAPGNAITPTNGLGVVPANHSNPADGTVYVNLYNDGAIGLYVFSPTDAQLFVMLVPVTE